GVRSDIYTTIMTADLVAALPSRTYEALSPMRAPARLTLGALGSTPLIGFAGAPFTVAAYMVEGKPSRDHLGPRTMMHTDREVWDGLMSWAANASGKFLRAQVEAGASAAQLFDSWAGSLSLPDYQKFVAPYSVKSLDYVRDLGVPLIHFGTGTGELLTAMRDAGVDTVGVDYRIPLETAIERLGQDVSV